METTQQRNVQIATEGLRLVLECKMPQFSSSAGFDHIHQQQKEWSKWLPHTLPPLLDWIEQHRHPLLEENNLGCAAVQEFQRRFLLVFLEQDSDLLTGFVGDIIVRDRLLKFRKDVDRILTTNPAIRSWLFHYYGSELGLQGWKRRPGDLYSLSRLITFVDRRFHEVDVVFGQRMFSFMEYIGKELLGVKQYLEYQKIGLLILDTIMRINHEKENIMSDAGKILEMVLQLNMNAIDSYKWYKCDCYNIIYYSAASICDAKNAKTSLDDEIMLHLLAYLNDELVKTEGDPDNSVGPQSLGYLRAVTLLLLLEVPEIDMDDYFFDEIIISDCPCDHDEFLQHVKSHLRTTDDLRFSTNTRLRIVRMIPRLFAGFTSIYHVYEHAYKWLKLITWMVMFPVNEARQQNNARGIMLKRLLDQIKRLCESFLEDPSDYYYSYDELLSLYTNLQALLAVVREAVKLLPDAGRFRRYKCDMETRLAAVWVMLDRVNLFLEQD